MLLSITKLAKTIGEKTLFQNLDFAISEGEKWAIVGTNGSGKSTLLRCLLGQEEVDSGQIIRNNDLKISALHQNPQFSPKDTILQHLYSGSHGIVQLLQSYEDICERMSSSQENLEEEYNKITKEMDRLSAWDYEQQIKSILKELGVTNLEAEMGTLSGGMLKKVELAKALIDESNLLILDEPTNHLDVEAILWLEEYLAQSEKAILLITHDRYFLDRVVEKILEMDQGKHFVYEGNYSLYLERKVEREETLRRQEDKIQQFLKQEAKWLQRQPKARTTKQKARIERANALENRERIQEKKDLELSVAAKRQGKTILELHNIKKSYSNREILNGFTYHFKAKERIGLIGPNGIGKSTFLNLIAGRESVNAGTIKLGVNTRIGYFDQTSRELPLDRKVLEFIKDSAGEMIETESGEKVSAAKILERFLFDGKLQHTPIVKLSGGERRRLYLVQILMQNPNFLILDEPTNDLDIQTLSILESFLLEFPGTVLVVSHDRYFLDRVAESLFVFLPGGKLESYVGTFSDYLDLLPFADAFSPNQILESPKTKEKPKPNSNKKIEKLEKEIETLETQKADLENKMEALGNDHLELQELLKKIQGLELEIQSKLQEWEKLHS